MSKRSILVLVASLAVIFGAASAFADEDRCTDPPTDVCLRVNGAAAIEGDFGLEVVVPDGASNATFVASTEATDETVYRIQFRGNPNDIAMEEGDKVNLFMGRMQGGEGNIIRLFMKRQGGTYKLRCRWKKNGGGTGFCGQFTFAPNNTRIGLEWMAGDGNGSIKLLKGNSEQFFRDDLANDDYDIDTARLGMPQEIGGASIGIDGSYYLDDFQSFRTLAPM